MSIAPLASADNLHGGVYMGAVMHQRFAPKRHGFSYNMGMLVLDLDELSQVEALSKVFSVSGVSALRFNCNDYLNQLENQFADALPLTPQDRLNTPLALKSRVLKTVQHLGGSADITRVLFAGQVRHFGLYFSPVNFYFCYANEQIICMLAEVSNTPWNERHCYLVPIDNAPLTDKVFSVSPFMNLDMGYRWRIKAPQQQLFVGIQNIDKQHNKLFEANLHLQQQALSAQSLRRFLWEFPFLTLKIVLGIYWQALKIWLKRIPFIGKSVVQS